ncbi:hypothetical protein DVR12_10815 [Chitinophaga silvatica]|uniref:Uncharacterized protein n=2 Tax=Chitinophaga silvatica TaxID=2282649 RepID=A0A3E1YBT7_9BACT|nr:hypothetical protein DVR12_10815 [Chitinophaga silvatica]
MPQDTSGWAFSGTPISPLLRQFLPEEITKNETSFACYQFRLDDNTIGLITRVPSVYDATSINLSAYHKNSKKITFEAELSETFGDAGDVMSKSTILYRNAAKKWEAILEYYESHEELEEDTNTQSNTYTAYYQYRWNQQKFDTIGFDSSKLAPLFTNMSK